MSEERTDDKALRMNGRKLKVTSCYILDGRLLRINGLFRKQPINLEIFSRCKETHIVVVRCGCRRDETKIGEAS